MKKIKVVNGARITFAIDIPNRVKDLDELCELVDEEIRRRYIFQDDEKLTEFENAVKLAIDGFASLPHDRDHVVRRDEATEYYKKVSSSLLELARKVIVGANLIFSPKQISELSDNMYEIGKRHARNGPTPRWIRIKKGERLPCPAYVWSTTYESYNHLWQGQLVPNVEGVIMGCDTWYLPADDIKNLPKDE